MNDKSISFYKGKKIILKTDGKNWIILFNIEAENLEIAMMKIKRAIADTYNKGDN